MSSNVLRTQPFPLFCFISATVLARLFAVAISPNGQTRRHRHDQNQGINFLAAFFFATRSFIGRDTLTGLSLSLRTRDKTRTKEACLATLRISRTLPVYILFWAAPITFHHPLYIFLVFFFFAFVICHSSFDRITSKLRLTSVPMLIHNHHDATFFPELTFPSILGNFYSIANLSETQSARIFFAQGCEVSPEISGFDDSQAA